MTDSVQQINAVEGMVFNWKEAGENAGHTRYAVEVDALGTEGQVFFGHGSQKWLARLGKLELGDFESMDRAKAEVEGWCQSWMVKHYKKSVELLEKCRTLGLSFGYVNPDAVVNVPHTTLIGEWRTCNFCGATQNASSIEPMEHHLTCCVPYGQEAIDKELAVIERITSATEEDLIP